jgi:catechol 2,3-dioxygenase-like lactoylglutathione lyase family enzyme
MLDKPKNITAVKKPTVEFNHLIILAKEKKKTANFITRLLNLPEAIPADGAVPDFFLCIQFDNDVMILITEFKDHPIGHYAFKVDNAHFEAIVEKMKTDKQDFWAGPRMQRPYEYYEQEGNRGFYVIDPSGHGLEVLTRVDR